VANVAADRKRREYEAHFDFTPASRVRFYPFSVDVFGSLDKDAVKVIHWLASFAYPLQEVDGEVRDVDGRRSYYISRMFSRISAAMAQAQTDRITAWIARLLSKKGELVLLTPDGLDLAAQEDIVEDDDDEDVEMDVEDEGLDGREEDEMESVLGEHADRDMMGPVALGARVGSPGLNNHYSPGSEGT